MSGSVDASAQALDVGETEGLAIIARNDIDDCKFCTWNTNALQAIGMLAFSELAISTEQVLEFGGLKVQVPMQLRPHLQQQIWVCQVKIGSQRRMSGNTLAVRPSRCDCLPRQLLQRIL